MGRIPWELPKRRLFLQEAGVEVSFADQGIPDTPVRDKGKLTEEAMHNACRTEEQRGSIK